MITKVLITTLLVGFQVKWYNHNDWWLYKVHASNKEDVKIILDNLL